MDAHRGLLSMKVVQALSLAFSVLDNFPSAFLTQQTHANHEPIIIMVILIIIIVYNIGQKTKISVNILKTFSLCTIMF